MNPRSEDLPPSLLEWTTRDVLLRWIHEVLKSDSENPQPCLTPAFLRSSLDVKTLKTLSFCYLIGEFDTEEIIDEHAISGGPPLFVQDLVRFRRTHGHLLVDVMTRVIARALAERNKIHEKQLTVTELERIRDNARTRVRNGWHMEREAE